MRKLCALVLSLVLSYSISSAAPTAQNSDQDKPLPTTRPSGDTGKAMAKQPVTIIAHRGLHHKLPENSKEAMVAGWKAGIEWCECDVYLSADGIAFIMHDAKLDRTTASKGPATDLKWDELKAIRLKDHKGDLTKCKIPSLEEVLAVMPAGRGLVIEMKPADDEKLVREVLRLSKGKKVVLQSFDTPNVKHTRRLAKDVTAALLVGKAEHLAEAMTGDWPQLNIDFKLLNDEVIKQAHEAGKSLGVYTVNEPADIQRILDLGIRRIITDQPERIKKAARSVS